MNAVVVDTNVILAAKGMSEQAWPECVVACQERLDEIIEGPEKVVIDDKWIILREYIGYLEDDDSTTDTRNGGHFLEWFIRNYKNPENVCWCLLRHLRMEQVSKSYPMHLVHSTRMTINLLPWQSCTKISIGKKQYSYNPWIVSGMEPKKCSLKTA